MPFRFRHFYLAIINGICFLMPPFIEVASRIVLIGMNWKGFTIAIVRFGKQGQQT